MSEANGKFLDDTKTYQQIIDESDNLRKSLIAAHTSLIHSQVSGNDGLMMQVYQEHAKAYVAAYAGGGNVLSR